MRFRENSIANIYLFRYHRKMPKKLKLLLFWLKKRGKYKDVEYQVMKNCKKIQINK